MGEMLEELLNLSRLGRQPLVREQLLLEQAVRDAIHGLERENSSRQVEWKIGELPALSCDPILMRQLFYHLLANALKFTRPRSHAVVEVGTEQQAGLVFFVRDNGVGFDMQYADRLFNIFQRLHPQEDFEGYGAGLALAQRIVHKHGGRIWAESAVDQGTTFFFTLESSSGAQVPLQR